MGQETFFSYTYKLHKFTECNKSFGFMIQSKIVKKRDQS